MLATDIPLEVIDVLIGVVTPMVVGLLAWVVRELSRVTSQNSATEEKQRQHDGRITDLEHWRETISESEHAELIERRRFDFTDPHTSASRTPPTEG